MVGDFFVYLYCIKQTKMENEFLKKYKLVKKYPSLPRDFEEGDIVTYSSEKDYYVDNKNRFYNVYEVENNGEFWAYVRVKNYEILQVTYGGKIYESKGERREAYPSKKMVNVFYNEGNGIVTDENLDTETHRKKKGKWKVRPSKIKRLSDNLEVQVGDYVFSEGDNGDIRVEEIVVDETFFGGIYVVSNNGLEKTSINALQKSDKVYELSEEGVKIYAGDRYWFIWTSHPYEFHDTYTIYEIDHYIPAGKDVSKADTAKWFASRKSAEAYLESQVLFETEDGCAVFNGDTFYRYNTQDKVLREDIARGFFDKQMARERGEIWFSSLEELESYLQQRKPLFKTEQGTKIFEGDSYWCVNTAPHLWSIFEQTAKERTQLNKTVLAFDTEKDAQRYIDDHKPLFTKTEVENLTYDAMKELEYTPISRWQIWAKEALKK